MLKVVKVTRVDQKQDKVYNIGVNNNHNYVIRPKGGTPFLVKNCHQLTPAAEQALLKSLEEPKANTLWILATTNPEKLKPAIINRCMHLRLMPVEAKVMSPRIKMIAEENGVKLSKEQATMLSEYSGGSVRQAIASLEEIINVVQSKGKKADISKLIEEIFQNSEEMELATIGLGLLIYMYEGKKAPLLTLISQVKDWAALVNSLPYMNGYLMYHIMSKLDSTTQNPYFNSYANKQLVGAMADYINDKNQRMIVLSNAIKASHKLFALREALFSSSFPDKTTLAINYLLDEPEKFVSIGASETKEKPAKAKKKKK